MTNLNAPNRDHQHGGLESVGFISQQIKGSMREGINWTSLALHPAAKEALDMIAHKIARVLSGSDPHDFQHWEDIAGYATAFMRTWSELTYEGDGEDDEEEDADVIKDEATEKSKINLNACKIGQKLKLRDGSIVTYEGAIGYQTYPHKVSHRFYTDEGECYDLDEDYEWDVVEILPLEGEGDEEEETEKPEINLNTCKIGQKLKLRNGQIVGYGGASGSRMHPHNAGHCLYTDEGKSYYLSGGDEWDVVEILPLEDEDDKEEVAFPLSPKAVAIAEEFRSWLGPRISNDAECHDGFCPMPSVRQGPAVMFDPAD